MNVARAACAAGEFQSGALSLLQQTHKTQRPRAQSPAHKSAFTTSRRFYRTLVFSFSVLKGLDGQS